MKKKRTQWWTIPVVLTFVMIVSLVSSSTKATSLVEGSIIFANADASRESRKLNLSVIADGRVVDLPDSHPTYIKEIYPSSRELGAIAVTGQPADSELGSITYILDRNGEEIVAPVPGDFLDWNEARRELYVHRSDAGAGDSPKIMSLTLNGDYRDAGFSSDVYAIRSNRIGDLVLARENGPAKGVGLWLQKSGGQPIQFYETGKAEITWLDWSPDGRSIGLALRESREKDDSASSVMTFNIDDISSPTELLRGISPRDITWSPSGRSIAYFAEFEGVTQVNSVNVETRDVRSLTNLDRSGLGFLSVFDEDAALFTRSDGNGMEIWSIVDGRVSMLSSTRISKAYPHRL